MTRFAPVSHRFAANVGRVPQAEALVYGPIRLRYADLWASVASVASFALPYRQMDLALWAYEHDVPVEELGEALRIPPDRVELVYRDIQAKRRASAYSGAPPVSAGGI